MQQAQVQRYDDDVPLPPYQPGGGGRKPTKPRNGPCQILPFPMVARIGFIDRTAELAASYRDPRKYLASVYRQQEQSLRRRGFHDDVVRSEMAALQRAIVAQMAEFEVCE